MEIIYSNKQNLNKTLEKLKQDWTENLHIVADFDRTLTKAFSAWKKRPSLISVLRSDWYLWEEYSKKAYELFDYYNPIELNPNIDIAEKNKQMTNWRNKHLDLLIKSWLNQKDIESVIKSRLIEFRDWVKDFLKFLKIKNIPLVIISANWLWTDSTKLYFKNQWVLENNIHIISNSFIWDKSWKAISYDKRVVHVFNKWEVVLKNYPEIYSKIENKKNVILLWDSLWDHTMIDWFDYNNLLKIWFLNNKEDELLDEYKQRYDIIVSWDGDFSIVNEILEKI